MRQWKRQADSEYEAGKKNLTGSDVWSADFVAAEPGRYRIVVEGVGCSPDFEVSADIYREPFRYSVRGYYYMRLDEPVDTPRVLPVPRQPQFVAGGVADDFKIYKTDLQPWHPEWRKLRMDVWDEPHFKRRRRRCSGNTACRVILWQKMFGEVTPTLSTGPSYRPREQYLRYAFALYSDRRQAR